MKRFRWLILILCFAWMAFVYASFYLVRQQRPFDGENLAAAGATALALCTAGGLFALGAALGRRVSIWLRIEFAGVGEQVILTTGLGLGALSLGILVLGLLGGLRRAILFSLLGALALLLVPDGIALVRALRGIHLPGTRTVLALYLTAMLVLTLLIALAPPTDWDGLFYHLTFPRLYLERGRIVAVTDVPHQFFPGMMEMLFTAAMAVQGDVAAKLLHMGYGLLLGGLVFLVAREYVGRAHAWPAVTVYAATPMVWTLAGWAYNDLALAFYQLAALYALFRWFRGQRVAWLVLSGAMCGCAMGLKYTSFVCSIAILFLVTWHAVRRGLSWGRWLRATAILAAVATLVALPWYARNLAFTGNPFYPFAYRVFWGGGGGMRGALPGTRARAAGSAGTWERCSGCPGP